MYQTIAIMLTCAAFAQNAFGAEFDWPQWQGPDRTARSTETGLLEAWPKDGPPLAWKVKGLGGGDSTPSVPAWSYRESPLIDGDKVICTPGSDGAMLVALNKLTGETIWKTQMPGSSESAPVSTSNPDNGPGERASGSAPGVTGTKDPNLF